MCPRILAKTKRSIILDIVIRLERGRLFVGLSASNPGSFVSGLIDSSALVSIRETSVSER